MSNETTLGQRLKEIREKQGLTQTDLAQRINIGSGSIWQWENDKAHPKSNHLKNICYALDVSADELLGLTSKSSNHVQEANGLRWHVTNPYPRNHELWDNIENGIEIFHLIVRDGFTLDALQHTAKFTSYGKTHIRRLLSLTLTSRAVKILGVKRDPQQEATLKAKFPHYLRKCIIADLNLPADPIIDTVIRKEAVAFLAMETALQVLPNTGLVGLTGGTTMARFVDLIPHASRRLGGISWVPLLATKPLLTIGAVSASSLAARMAYRQPGTTAYHLPFISSERRQQTYLIEAGKEEQQLLEYAQKVLMVARTAGDVFMSLGQPQFDLYNIDAYQGLGLSELSNMLNQLSPEDREACAGVILLYPVDKQGNILGDDNLNLANDRLVYSIGLASLKLIARHGTVWGIVASANKANITYAALVGGYMNCLVTESHLAEALLQA